MGEIIINAPTGIKWVLDTVSLSVADRRFILRFNPTVYWSDTDCRYWSFDTQLPSGRRIENMEIELGETPRISAMII